MDQRKKIVIIGATSAIAEHCARLWLAEQPADLVLFGRDARRLERIAADLGVRSPESAIRIRVGDFGDARQIDADCRSLAAEGFADIVLIAHGALADQQRTQGDPDACRQVLEINAVSPIMFAEAWAGQLQARGHGTLAIIGSVAGDRTRRANYLYGAAKACVASHAQGLQHRFAGRPVKVVLIKPGPTDTPMTAALKARGARLAPVQRVARDVVHAIARGQAQCYTPGIWRLIMAVVRHLPTWLFNRLDL